VLPRESKPAHDAFSHHPVSQLRSQEVRLEIALSTFACLCFMLQHISVKEKGLIC
jgi:hypothetical protein